NEFEITLSTIDADVVHLEESIRDRILKTLANPNIAYILMMLGLAGLYFELSNPGAIFPGIMGGLFIILAFYAFHTLPVNYAGVLLILTLGSLMLIESPHDYLQISLSVILPTIAVVGGFFLVVTALVIKVQTRSSITGESGLIGLKGPVKEWEADQGKVLIHGEWWKAYGETDLEPGDKIEVMAVDGLSVQVKRTDHSGS
ncbi:MAG: nodulation protein NfeD, partial [Deltaproteobacteria bacterium]|nr:nodulation protein NfeD [Deltaproteobacteria bacterium]